MLKEESEIIWPARRKLSKKESNPEKNDHRQVFIDLCQGSVTKFKLVGGRTNEEGFNIKEVT